MEVLNSSDLSNLRIESGIFEGQVPILMVMPVMFTLLRIRIVLLTFVARLLLAFLVQLPFYRIAYCCMFDGKHFKNWPVFGAALTIWWFSFLDMIFIVSLHGCILLIHDGKSQCALFVAFILNLD